MTTLFNPRTYIIEHQLSLGTPNHIIAAALGVSPNTVAGVARRWRKRNNLPSPPRRNIPRALWTQHP